MQKVIRNPIPQQKKVPATLENTRPLEDYKLPVVNNFNERYKKLFSIDAAKAKLISVRQDSFRKEIAHVVLGEDIYDDKGKYLTTNQRSAKIERQDFNKGLIKVKRTAGESAYVTWQKVEVAAGLEPGELVAKMDLKSNAPTAVYELNELSLNWYGVVRVAFEYE